MIPVNCDWFEVLAGSGGYVTVIDSDSGGCEFSYVQIPATPSLSPLPFVKRDSRRASARTVFSTPLVHPRWAILRHPDGANRQGVKVSADCTEDGPPDRFLVMGRAYEFGLASNLWVTWREPAPSTSRFQKVGTVDAPHPAEVASEHKDSRHAHRRLRAGLRLRRSSIARCTVST